MAAGWYNFTIEQGATVDFELTYKDSNGDVVDLSKYTARMQVKNAKGGNQTYITLSSTLANDGTGLNMSGSAGTKPPSSGSIGVFISAYSSSQLTFSEGYYDIELVSGSTYPYVTRLLEGRVKLSKEVTTSS
jgi:hypothetical protein